MSRSLVLGIADGAEPAAALLADGVVIAVAGGRAAGGLAQAHACLDALGVGWDQLAAVVLATANGAPSGEPGSRLPVSPMMLDAGLAAALGAGAMSPFHSATVIVADSHFVRGSAEHALANGGIYILDDGQVARAAGVDFAPLWQFAKLSGGLIRERAGVEPGQGAEWTLRPQSQESPLAWRGDGFELDVALTAEIFATLAKSREAPKSSVRVAEWVNAVLCEATLAFLSFAKERTPSANLVWPASLNGAIATKSKILTESAFAQVSLTPYETSVSAAIGACLHGWRSSGGAAGYPQFCPGIQFHNARVGGTKLPPGAPFKPPFEQAGPTGSVGDALALLRSGGVLQRGDIPGEVTDQEGLGDAIFDPQALSGDRAEIRAPIVLIVPIERIAEMFEAPLYSPLQTLLLTPTPAWRSDLRFASDARGAVLVRCVSRTSTVWLHALVTAWSAESEIPALAITGAADETPWSS